MGAVAIVDTSILCNILNIPNRNGEREEVMKELKQFLEDNTNLLLPMAAVYETGNYIANLKLSNGNVRRKLAEDFVEEVEEVKKAITGEAPWQVMQVPTLEEVAKWLNSFPDSAMRKAGMGDLSIIKEWEKMRKKIPNRRVFIWSLDEDLQGYDSVSGSRIS